MLKVEVVSAEETVWSGEATRLIARSVDGELGILTGHAPTLTVLAPGQVRILTDGGETVTADVEDGFLSVDHDRVTVVADRAALASAAR